MNGLMHTCVMLAKAARGCLRCGWPPESLGDGTAVAPYAHAVVFTECGESDSPLPGVVASDPVAWLRHLMATDARDAWVVHVATGGLPVRDNVAAAFANGGGSWGILVHRDGAAEVWMPQLRLDAKQDSHRPPWWLRTFLPALAAGASRPWHVTVTRFPLNAASSTVPTGDLEACRSRLRAALARNQVFAATWRLAPWDVQFGRALGVLDDDGGRTDEVAIGPRGIFDAAADRLLQASAQAWCFGGMGTWNDIHVGDRAAQEEQFDLAAELYAAVTDAIQQATWPVAAA